MRTLLKDPHQRFASIQEFAAAFEQACHAPLSFSQPDLSNQYPQTYAPAIPLKPFSPPSTNPTLSPPAFNPSPAPSRPQPPKRGISRRAVLGGLAGLALTGSGITWWLLSHSPNPPSGTTSATITGIVQSVNASTHSVVLNVNGQSVTINGFTDQQIATLQSQVGKTYTIQATENSDGSYTIKTGTNPQEDTSASSGTQSPRTTQTQSVFEPGSIDFAGIVKSVNGQTFTVSMPDGSTLNINTVGNVPGVGQIEKISATANNDGSFTATQLSLGDSGDLNKTVKYVGVTTSAVGSDNIIHFNVGTHSFSFTIIPGTTDLRDFNNNPQSIGNNQAVTVEVQFNGANPTLYRVGNPYGH